MNWLFKTGVKVSDMLTPFLHFLLRFDARVGAALM